MGLINKPHTHVASTLIESAKVNANDDTLYNEFNGNITNANISASAAITQGKILNLVADLASKVADTGDTMTGPLVLRLDTPYLRLLGTETGGKDWRFIESSGVLILQDNSGTEAAPIWNSRFTFKHDGATADGDVPTKLYVDTYTRDLAYAQAILDGSPNFTHSSDQYGDMNGMTAIITLANAHRCRVYQSISGISSDSGATTVFRTVANGVVLTLGQMEVPSTDSIASKSYLTPVLAAGQYTFQIQWKTSAGTVTAKASGDAPASLQIEECPF